MLSTFGQKWIKRQSDKIGDNFPHNDLHLVKHESLDMDILEAMDQANYISVSWL